jgi:hypothetical protein
MVEGSCQEVIGFVVACLGSERWEDCVGEINGWSALSEGWAIWKVSPESRAVSLYQSDVTLVGGLMFPWSCVLGVFGREEGLSSSGSCVRWLE